MELLQFFGLWDEEIDSTFTNHETLIPTLTSTTKHEIWIQIWVKVFNFGLADNFREFYCYFFPVIMRQQQRKFQNIFYNRAF